MKPNDVYFCPSCQRTVNTWHWTEFDDTDKPNHTERRTAGGTPAPPPRTETSTRPTVPSWSQSWAKRAEARFNLWCCEQTGVLCVGRVAVDRG